LIFINTPHFSSSKYIRCNHIFSQIVSNGKTSQDESEPEPSPPPVEPPVTIRKQTPSVDTRSNRKSMFEQPTTQSNTHAIERVNSTS
jgi:hypothetical protein